MEGFTWAAAAWAIAIPFARRLNLISRVKREHLILLLLLLGTHAVKPRTTQEILADPVGLEATVRGTLSLIAALLAVPLLYRNRGSLQRYSYRGLTALAAYAIIAAITVLYSVAVIPSAGKVFQLSAGVLIIWVLATSPNGKEQILRGLRFVILLEAALVAFAVVGFFVLPGSFSMTGGRPGFFIPAQMVSPYASSNGLAATGGLLAAYAFAHLVSPPSRQALRGWIALALIATAAVVLASGRQGVVIWLASVLVLLWFYRRQLFGLIIGPAAGLLVAWNWSYIVEVFTRGRPDQTLAFSGRISWWRSALDAFWEHAWTGYGFGSGGRFVAQARIGNETVPGVHNGYVEALVGVGLIGVVPLAYVMWRVGSWAARELVQRKHPGFPILAIPLFLHTIVSLGFGGWLNSDFIVFGLLLGLADLVAGRRRRIGMRSSKSAAVRVRPGGAHFERRNQLRWDVRR